MIPCSSSSEGRARGFYSGSPPPARRNPSSRRNATNGGTLACRIGKRGRDTCLNRPGDVRVDGGRVTSGRDRAPGSHQGKLASVQWRAGVARARRGGGVMGSEAAPGKRSADMSMVERAIREREGKMAVLLASCPQLTTRLLLDLMANAGDPIARDTWRVVRIDWAIPVDARRSHAWHRIDWPGIYYGFLPGNMLPT